MFGLRIFVRVQTFWRVPPVLPCNFCHPDQDKSSSPPKQIQVITKDKSFSPQPWSRHRCPHRQLSSVEKCCRPWRSDCRSVALDYVNIFWSPIIKYWNRTLDEYFIISSPIGKDVLSLIDHLDGLVKGLKWHEHMFLLDVNAFLHCTEHEIFFLEIDDMIALLVSE